MIPSGTKRIFLGGRELTKVYRGAELLWETPSRLPAGYTQLEYIRGEGAQYINTGYSPVKSTVIEVGYRFTSIPSGQFYYVFGNYNAAGRNSTRLTTSRSSGQTVINMFSATDKNNFTINAAKTVGERYDDTVANGYYVTNGTRYEISNTTEGTSNSRVLALFANYVGGRESYLEMYYCRIREGDVLVYDFVPCLDADARVCLYDTVSAQPFYNSGTGEFGYAA